MIIDMYFIHAFCTMGHVTPANVSRRYLSADGDDGQSVFWAAKAEEEAARGEAAAQRQVLARVTVAGVRNKKENPFVKNCLS